MTDQQALEIIIRWAKIGVHKTAMPAETYAEANEAIRIMEDITLDTKE